MSKTEKRRIEDDSTRQEVADRDHGRCVICYKRAQDIHEIVPRSAFGHNKSSILFSLKNRVCLCRDCHSIAHTKEMRTRLLLYLQDTYQYDYNEEEFQKYLRNETNNE